MHVLVLEEHIHFSLKEITDSYMQIPILLNASTSQIYVHQICCCV